MSPAVALTWTQSLRKSIENFCLPDKPSTREENQKNHEFKANITYVGKRSQKENETKF
jgi:hypothetical protein